jgi:1-acyl-sn-glycerol-3-phosphate acyltransferase
MRKLGVLLCFAIFGLGSIVISAVVLPPLWLFVWGGDCRRLIIVRCVRLSWSLFRQIMESLHLIEVRASQEDRRMLASLSSTIIVSTHPSLIDIVLLVSMTKDATSIVRGGLFQNPLIRFIVANAFIGNDGDPDKLISRSVGVLKKGYNLIIFPEGTRNDGTLGGLKRGAAHIAVRSVADVAVLRIRPSPPVLRKGRGWRDAGESRAVYDISVRAILKTAGIVDAGKSRNINARAMTARIKEALEIQ